MSSVQRVKAHCNSCAQETTHVLLHTVRRRWDMGDEEGEPWGHELAEYETVQCCGCDEVKLKITSSSSEYATSVEYHPPATLRRAPKWLSDLLLEGVMSEFHKSLYQMLVEVYKAQRNGMSRLAAMGIRAILETIMIHQVEDQGTFKKNIDAFFMAGHVGAKQRTRIEHLLDAGGAVIHRRHAPNESDVTAMIDLTEHLIESIYIHGPQMEAVAKRTPPRPPRIRP